MHIESRTPTTASARSTRRCRCAAREITPRALRSALVRYPALTLRLTARIYAHALRLRLRGAAYHPHPGPGAQASAA